jgi:ubiquinone/menaquinone biosynthesis C-methylase UbiE
MVHERDVVERYYAREDLLDSILSALRRLGKDTARLSPPDLAPVDEFHIRGRQATVELAQRAALTPGLRVLDVGCGLGGSVRYLAAEHGCRVTGVDLTREYVDVARALAGLVGLGDAVEFHHGSALALPFDQSAFDVVWTEHVQMNIADKRLFYSEIARVLRPGGRLVFHDVLQGRGGPAHVPVPWAEDASICFLVTPATVREILERLGFTIVDWEDTSHESLRWFVAAADRLKAGPPPLGIHLLTGPTSAAKFENVISNLREERIVVLQAVARKEPP